MKLRFGSLGGGLFAVLLASAAPAAAAPIVFGNNAYEYVLAGGISWNAANAAAIGSTFSGQSGHLATITSAAENAFIDLIVNSGTEAWIGGFQPPGSPEPAGNWQWVNGEGLFTYTNWSAGEPNNASNEMFLGIIAATGVWNDEQNTGNISGYVVEYNNVVPEPATLMLVGSGLLAAVRRRSRRKQIV